MTTFKCKQTGNTVTFEYEWDITSMRSHPDYTEVIEEVKPVEVKAKKTISKSVEE